MAGALSSAFFTYEAALKDINYQWHDLYTKRVERPHLYLKQNLPEPIIKSCMRT